jgi:Secretion system C-terminal sorting domain
MKFFYLLYLIIFTPILINAQTVNVSGECITGTINLAKISDVNGKAAYQFTGTVDGVAGVTVSIYWLPAPDNLWVVDFDGQPYFQCACNTAGPPATPNPSCPWPEVPGTTCDGAAALMIGGSGALPVRFLSFTASREDNKILLKWKTATETNNKGFEVQRSRDGIDWTEIGFVNGAGNSINIRSYQFMDETPLSGNNYYRLVQYDLDDRRSYSTVVHVEFSTDAFYALSNNPGNGIYQLNILSTEPVELSVFDLAGRRLLTKIANHGVHQLDLSRHEDGIYLLRLRKGNTTVTNKLIKQ